MKYICETCMEVHGRNTNSPIQCPVCKQIVGCFWHKQNTAHIRNCRNDCRNDGLVDPHEEDRSGWLNMSDGEEVP